LEGKDLGSEAARPRGTTPAGKYDASRAAGGALQAAPRAYNADADVTADAGDKSSKKKARHAALA
jgi:hypothetical protein